MPSEYRDFEALLKDQARLRLRRNRPYRLRKGLEQAPGAGPWTAQKCLAWESKGKKLWAISEKQVDRQDRQKGKTSGEEILSRQVTCTYLSICNKKAWASLRGTGGRGSSGGWIRMGVSSGRFNYFRQTVVSIQFTS